MESLPEACPACDQVGSNPRMEVSAFAMEIKAGLM